jgi:hypothetical protein
MIIVPWASKTFGLLWVCKFAWIAMIPFIAATPFLNHIYGTELIVTLIIVYLAFASF